MTERIISPEPLLEEGEDLTIRPARLDEFIGQVQVKETLKTWRKEKILRSGRPGWMNLSGRCRLKRH